jgi:hypothetical protein
MRSKNAGAANTWETTDEFVHPTYSQISGATFPSGVALDGAGTIYVTGLAVENIVTVKGKTTTTTTVNHWLVIKSVVKADGTLGWQQIGDFAVPSAKYHDSWNCIPSGIACVGNDVFVIGGGGTNGIYWQVRKTSNGGATWAVVDNFLSDQSEPSHPYGIAADSHGTVYVVGSGGRLSQNSFSDSWIVRKGTAAGTVWTTVDQFRSPNVIAHAYGVAVDGADNVHVTGAGWTTSSVRRWVSRKGQLSTAGVWSWQTTDDFSYTPNASSQGNAIVAGPLGSVLSLGSGTDSAGVAHNWVLRRNVPPAP